MINYVNDNVMLTSVLNNKIQTRVNLYFNLSRITLLEYIFPTSNNIKIHCVNDELEQATEM